MPVDLNPFNNHDTHLRQMQVSALQRQCGHAQEFYGLAALVRYAMQSNVLSGDVFIFISKRRNAIKLLRLEADGFAIF